MGDGNLEVGWYRFNSSGGRKIPEIVVRGHRCSGQNPGWLNGSHPSVGEQEVTRSVCFSSGENTCSWSLEIKVKNCTGYFVYWLKPTPADHTVYCTAADSALADPCVTHTVLDQPWRSTDCNHTECTGGQWMGDEYLEVGWYRFNSSRGQKIPETAVQGHCSSGKKPGWLNATDSALGDPCVTHTVLDQPWRSTNCSNAEHTDGQWKGDEYLEVGWYRFNSSGGWKIPETVVPQGHCSGETPGWLNGLHPSLGEGEVTRTVCFTEVEDSCSWD
ncbi:uromodulin-like [Mobula hypostoma]|uniref:uromodulin-like n=1 Tax=Mobula hypostoma TaxID=723540 RepID=UPI002FC34D36